jgi:hypothetical protein
MTERLSSRFFGKKLLAESVYADIKANPKQKAERLAKEYPGFPKVRSSQKQAIWHQFLEGLLDFAEQEDFQVLSTTVEIGAEVFIRAVQQRMTRGESYNYFNELVVRHSLFHPPISVHVFSLEQAKTFSAFWTDTFHRFFEMYEEIFIEVVNKEVVTLRSLPRESPCPPLRDDAHATPE